MNAGRKSIYQLGHKELLQTVKRKCVPPLLPSFHKGQNGRVCVIGGCEDYTGAPFFSANATALTGCDMTHLICEEQASLVIKSYSPNLMVHPYLKTGSLGDMDKIKGMLDRIHVVVIGPGLGRDRGMLETVKQIIEYLLKSHEGKIPIVLDADGLYLVSEDNQVRDWIGQFPQGRVILTPNAVEFQRLYKSLKEKSTDDEDGSVQKGAFIAKKLNCIVIEKGSKDRIFAPTNYSDVLENGIEGSLKRVGGQGDTLTGVTACMLAYCRAMYDFQICEGKLKEPIEPLESWLDYAMLSCYAGSTITRECSRLAFKDIGRAMQTTDLNNRVGQVFDKIFT